MDRQQAMGPRSRLAFQGRTQCEEGQEVEDARRQPRCGRSVRFLDAVLLPKVVLTPSQSHRWQRWQFHLRPCLRRRSHGAFACRRMSHAFCSYHAQVPYDQPEAASDLINRWLSKCVRSLFRRFSCSSRLAAPLSSRTDSHLRPSDFLMASSCSCTLSPCALEPHCWPL